MSEATWSAVDSYLASSLKIGDAILDGVIQSSVDAGMPQIHVSPTQGRFLNLLAQMLGAKRILEIGTLAGYSTIWMARALPASGTLVTLEYETKHADVARANFASAGLADRIDVRVGLAKDSLEALMQEGVEPFDLVFIDADKPSNPIYLDYALKLTRVGSVIIGDNVVRKGAVADLSDTTPAVLGTRALLEAIGECQRLEATALQTVGDKGYDGFVMARVVR